LLKKRSFNESLFWIFEYYYSGYKKKTWNLLWQVYYDFYAIQYPKYEKMIEKQYKINNENAIIYVVKNLYLLNPTPDVFILRMLQPAHPTHIYKGKTPSWATKDKKLILAIHNKHLDNIAFYIRTYKGKEHKCYSIIREYFHTVHHLTLKEKGLNDVSYKDKIHILMTLVLYLHYDENKIHKKAMFVKIDKNDINFIQIIHTNPITPLYKTLEHKRLFEISPYIGGFGLQRHNDEWPPVDQVLWHHWEYFAYFCPLWKKRFKQYNILVDNENHSIQFHDDDQLEDFYEKYNYEPDEQSKEVQLKSIRDIPVCTIEHWIYETFKN